jgi:serine phosphatase RsbU (regulator of sigma subunit)
LGTDSLFHSMKLRGKVALSVIVPLAVLLAVVIRADLMDTRSRLLEAGADQLRRSTRNTASILEGQCSRIAQVADTASISVADVKDWTRDELFALAHGIVARDPVLFGFGVAWEANPGPEDLGIFCGYAQRTDGGIEEIDLSKKFDIERLPRYRRLRSTKDSFWERLPKEASDAEEDLIVYLAPVMSDGAFLGGVVVDIQVSSIVEIVDQAGLRGEEWGVVDHGGNLIAASKGAVKQLAGRDSVGSIRVRRVDADPTAPSIPMMDLVRRSEKGEVFVEKIVSKDYSLGDRMVAFAPLESTGWVLISGRSLEVMTEATNGLVLRRAIGLIAIAVTAIAIVLFGTWRVILKPVRRITGVLDHAASGDRSARVGLGGHDELAALGNALDDALPRLDELARTQASLDAARVVQESLLPSEALHERGIGIAGRVIPSDQTGGDYFDFGVLDDRRIAIGLGDATGHGIPSALFVATERAYVRASIFNEPDLASAIAMANERLTDESSAGLFMVLFSAIVDTSEGTLEVASAGHPGYLIRKGESTFQEIEAAGIPLGIQSTTYRSTKLEGLTSGDVLFLASDGAWECRNPAGELLGLERLLAEAVRHRERSAEDQVEAMFDFVSDWASGRPLDDDCTIVVLRFD